MVCPTAMSATKAITSSALWLSDLRVGLPLM